MGRRQRWAGWVMIGVLTWLVATVAGVLAFVPRQPDDQVEQIPQRPNVAATPSKAVASFPGCVPSAEWPRNRAADWVVVAWPDGRVERMRFGDAWTRGTNATHADDVWVIGVCSR